MEARGNERQSCDSSRSTKNARSVRTNFCVLGGDTTASERTLAIRIVAIARASGSAINVAQFRPSKVSIRGMAGGVELHFFSLNFQVPEPGT